PRGPVRAPRGRKFRRPTAENPGPQRPGPPEAEEACSRRLRSTRVPYMPGPGSSLPRIGALEARLGGAAPPAQPARGEAAGADAAPAGLPGASGEFVPVAVFDAYREAVARELLAHQEAYREALEARAGEAARKFEALAKELVSKQDALLAARGAEDLADLVARHMGMHRAEVQKEIALVRSEAHENLSKASGSVDADKNFVYPAALVTTNAKLQALGANATESLGALRRSLDVHRDSVRGQLLRLEAAAAEGLAAHRNLSAALAAQGAEAAAAWAAQRAE
ncbi:unnamed protein product, partial [Prorocentrum cordatum]